MHEPEFALAESDPLGKCSAEIKVSLPESVADHIQFLATAHGQTKSEYIRELVTDHCLGKIATVRMRLHRPLRSA